MPEEQRSVVFPVFVVILTASSSQLWDSIRSGLVLAEDC